MRADGKDTEAIAAPRLGAIATGLASDGEIVFFDPLDKVVTDRNAIGKISLGKGVEAADIDIRTTTDGDFQVVYCTDTEIYVLEIPGTAAKRGKSFSVQPKLVYSRSVSNATGKYKFRSVRFLTASIILILTNLPGRTGSELLVIKTYDGGADLKLRRQLNLSMKASTGLDVTQLADTQGDEKQFVIAVAGQNNSAEILSLDWTAEKGLETFRSVAILSDIHPWPITAMKFALFRWPNSQSTEKLNKTRQYLRLVSVSSGKTCVVHSIPLRPVIFGGQISYFVVNSKRRAMRTHSPIAVLSSLFFVTMSAFFIHAALEFLGYFPPILGLNDILPISPQSRERAQDFIISSPLLNPRGMTKEYLFPWTDFALHGYDEYDITRDTEESDEIDTKSTPIEDIHEIIQQAASKDDVHVIISAQPDGDQLVADVHSAPEHAEAQGGTKWEDLPEKQKQLWREKLKSSGNFLGGQGETVLKGVFFAELAGVIGQVIGG
jgi:hypothetical protein